MNVCMIMNALNTTMPHSMVVCIFYLARSNRDKKTKTCNCGLCRSLSTLVPQRELDIAVEFGATVTPSGTQSLKGGG